MLIDLLRESVLIQALMALSLLVAMIIMAIRGQNPPEWMVQLLMIVVGFYFGGKVERAIGRFRS